MTTTTETANVSAPVIPQTEPTPVACNGAMVSLERILADKDSKAILTAFLSHSLAERAKGTSKADLYAAFEEMVQRVIGDAEDIFDTLQAAPSYTFPKDWGYVDADGTPMNAKQVARSIIGLTTTRTDLIKTATRNARARKS